MVQEINNLVAEQYNVLPQQTVNRTQYEPLPTVEEASPPVEPIPESVESSMPQSLVDTYA